jgi:hypothetical protein
MKNGIIIALIWCGLTCAAFGQETARKYEPSTWGQSVVVLEVTRKQYDFLQPWSKRLKSTQKTGVVVGPSQILTTADEMFDRTLVRVQRGGRGKWWLGELTWVDYHANLALVTVTEEDFWKGLDPVELPEVTPSEGSMQIVRWRQGRLEARRAEFQQFTVDEGRLSYAPQFQMEISSEIQGAGLGEPVVSQSMVLGLVVAQEGTTCKVLPSAFIRPILDARRQGAYRGLGYFHFVWQPAENPDSHAYLQRQGEPQGVLIISVPPVTGLEGVVQARDILLKVDGFDIDTQGDYDDPHYGHLSLENLATRGKWAGEDVQLQVWRGGKLEEVTYRLPKAEYDATLVPDAVYDQDPEYLIVGGLIFQPLNDAFLQSWGPDWKRRSPFRLYHFNNDHPSPERPALVILSQVLPDIYNLGYQELKLLVLDRVNGHKISRLPELREALRKSSDGFHVIEFFQSDSLRRMVLAADDQEMATRRVLTRYGIANDYYFATPQTKQENGVALSH